MKNSIKSANIKIFYQAYLCSYIATIVLFVFRKPLVFMYQWFLNRKPTHQFSEIFIISDTEFLMALISPLSLPITSIFMSRWLPQYSVIAVIYFLLLFGFYKFNKIIIKNRFFILFALILILNLTGIYISIILATSI